ncbi:MAG: HEAT repeat domain-containing protein [Chloroflexi bacterium]|nr:HEAT repeat domain-containing protein [Chloroflexota bacterium]
MKDNGVADSRATPVLDFILDSSRPLTAARLAELSDIDRRQLERFRAGWKDVPVERRRQIVSQMAELAEDNFELDFARVFLEAVRDPDAAVRSAAASGLVLSEESEVVAPLVRLLVQDDSEPVRVAAALSLGKFVLQGELGKIGAFQTEKAREALLQVVEDKKHSPELRRRALESLSPWSSPRVTELIANAYRSTEPGLKASAVYAMGMNCDARWLPALYAEMANPDGKLRYEAAHAAGEVAEPSALPHLLPLLRDNDIEVRVAAIWSLGQIGGKAAKEALRRLQSDPDEKVREAVEQAMSEIALGDDTLPL